MLVPFLGACAPRKTSGSTQSPSPVTTPAPTPSPSGSQGTGPSASYLKFIEVKGAAYDKVGAFIDSNEEYALTLGMALLPVAMVDLSLVPLTVIDMGEAGADALKFMGLSNIDINVSGNTYKMTYKDEEGSVFEQTCEFDPATDSIKSISVQDGVEIIIMEYVKSGDGYVSQYYLLSDDEISVIKMFMNSNIVAFGFDETDTKPASIFKTSGYNASFVENDDLYFILEGDEIKVYEEGVLKEEN